MTDGLLRAGRNDRASIMVHVRAIRMLAPGSAPLTPEQIDKVLSELAKVIAYHGFAKLSESADKVALEAANRAALISSFRRLKSLHCPLLWPEFDRRSLEGGSRGFSSDRRTA